MADKKLVFIHGSDPAHAHTPWMFYHLDPSFYQGTPVQGEGLVFDLVYFDFEKGTRSTWKNWKTLRSHSAPKDATTVDALTPTVKIRDNKGKEIEGQPEYPSVIAFYDWVKAQPEKSIASIQIFSHGVTYQPVLFALSYEWGDNRDKRNDLTAARDPQDTEFRLRDFEGSNPLGPVDLGAGAGSGLARFKTALAPDCFIKIWGCGEQTRTGHGAPIRKLVTKWVNLQDKDDPKGTQRATLLLGYLDFIKSCFPYRMAEALDMPVWAAPIGWGSDPNELDGEYDPKTYAKEKYNYSGKFPPNLAKKELWWRVTVNFRIDERVANKFFNGALGAALDPMSYVEYRKSWVKAAEDKANQVLPQPTAGPGVMQAPKQLQQALLDRIQQLGLTS